MWPAPSWRCGPAACCCTDVTPGADSPAVQMAFLAALPAMVQQQVRPDAPVSARLAAAKGLLPLPPRELLLVLMAALHDAAPEVAQAAAHTLQTLPDKLLLSALDHHPKELPAALWTPLAQAVAQRPSVVRAVATHQEAPDAVVADLARSAPADLVEMLANNQERCLRSQAYVEALCHNAALSRASLDRVFDFLVRSGIFYAELPQSAEALARLTPTEVTAAAQKVVLPAAVAALLLEAPQAEGGPPGGRAVWDGRPAATAGGGASLAESGSAPAGGASAALGPEAGDVDVN